MEIIRLIIDIIGLISLIPVSFYIIIILYAKLRHIKRRKKDAKNKR